MTHKTHPETHIHGVSVFASFLTPLCSEMPFSKVKPLLAVHCQCSVPQAFSAQNPRFWQRLSPNAMAISSNAPVHEACQDKLYMEAESQSEDGSDVDVQKPLPLVASERINPYSPTRLRHTAQSCVSTSTSSRVRELPKASELGSAAQLLAWYCSDLLEKAKITKERKSIRKKRAMTLEELLLLFAAHPDKDYKRNVQWRERQLAGFKVAKVYSAAYGDNVVTSRQKWAPLWNAAPRHVKDNWTQLINHAELQALLQQLPGWSKSGVVDEKHDICCVGALFTWHSKLGRGDPQTDEIAAWVANRMSVDAMVDLMRGQHKYWSLWQTFCESVKDFSDKSGFKHHSCCMEVNPLMDKAIIHFHAFACVDMHRGSNGRQHASVDVEKWRWMSYEPDVQCSNIKRNADPRKICAGGFIYCLVPKYGSIYHHGTLQPGPDTGNSSRFSALSWTAACRQRQSVMQPPSKLVMHVDRMVCGS